MTTVFLCAPVYRAMMPEAITSFLKATAMLEAYGFKVTMPEFVTECPYAHLARTELLERYLHSQCEIMWGIDDDMEFSADTVHAMCDALRLEKADLIGGAYSLRWGTRFAVEYLPGTIEAKRFIGFRHLEHQFAQVSAFGTGLFVASRRAVVRMIDACPEAIVGAKVEPKIMLFDHTRQRTEGGVILPRGEDYSFCDYARKAGVKVYCCVSAKTKHYARYAFEGDMYKQLVEGGATFEDPEATLRPEGAE